MQAAEVAPHAGAWIETFVDQRQVTTEKVAPHAGAWIETVDNQYVVSASAGRTPRGCVD